MRCVSIKMAGLSKRSTELPATGGILIEKERKWILREEGNMRPKANERKKDSYSQPLRTGVLLAAMLFKIKLDILIHLVARKMRMYCI